MQRAKKPTGKQRAGIKAERQAERHLKGQGMKTLARNYHCRQGEIDLIMQHSDGLAFVEVRFRSKTTHFVDSLESIGYQKQQRLIKAAQHFLATHTEHQSQPCRFDVVGIDGAGWFPKIRWIPDAFQIS